MEQNKECAVLRRWVDVSVQADREGGGPDRETKTEGRLDREGKTCRRNVIRSLCDAASTVRKGYKGNGSPLG